MKRAALAVLLSSAIGSTLAAAADLKVEVHGISEAKGEVFVALYNQEGSWMKKPVAGQKVNALKGTTSLTFINLTEGDYALSVYHDEDGNQKMGRNAMGIPIEPFGFSRDATGMFGPPSFDDAKVTLPTDGTTVVINLKR